MSCVDLVVLAREGAHLEVLADRHAREDAPALGRLGDADLARPRGRSVSWISRPSKTDRALLRRQDPGDRAQRRRLAGAVGADQRDDLARVDLERDALERLDRAVEGVDVLDLEDRLACGTGGGVPVRASSCLAPEVRLDDARVRAHLRGAPSAIFSPWSSTVMWSETFMTTFMSCSISRTEMPCSARSVLHQLAQLLGLLRVHAGGRLVEQQQLRARTPARARSRGGAGRRRAGSSRARRGRLRPTKCEQLARALLGSPSPRGARTACG